MVRTAIMVDGGFYRKRAARLWGKKAAEQRANELYAYCMAHIDSERRSEYARYLYRIFYYDCPPLGKTLYHPLTQRGVDFRRSDTYEWSNTFFNQLRQQRKVALRLGELADSFAAFRLRDGLLRSLCDKTLSIDDLAEQDFEPNFTQKGVDMKIGVDIASLAYKRQVDQIILISNDSDFVPAAKLARREGIDFILDPMWENVRGDLFEHIDGLQSQWGRDRKQQESKTSN